jgi:hypothetical protein
MSRRKKLLPRPEWRLSGLPRYFWDTPQNIGRKVSGGIELDMTNEELAEAANINVYTVV